MSETVFRSFDLQKLNNSTTSNLETANPMVHRFNHQTKSCGPKNLSWSANAVKREIEIAKNLGSFVREKVSMNFIVFASKYKEC